MVELSAGLQSVLAVGISDFGSAGSLAVFVVMQLYLFHAPRLRENFAQVLNVYIAVQVRDIYLGAGEENWRGLFYICGFNWFS